MTAAIATLLVSACAIDDDAREPASGSRDAVGDLEGAFADAARTFEVPADLLAAVAYVETRWQHVAGEDELGRPTAHGVFGLWGDNLARGAAAAGIDLDAARTTIHGNVAAAAARLAELAAVHGVAGDELAAWAPVLADFAQIPDADARAGYVADVMRVLATGARVTLDDGRVVASLSAHPEIDVPVPPAAAAGTDFADAIWRPSPNYNSRSSAVTMVVIHSCEGGYAGCWGWLRNANAKASAHYVVNESGSEVTQLVREVSRAWHVSASYECSRAGDQQCNRNGTSVNDFAVGIEHAGFAAQASWSGGIIETSARLTCDITKRHGIPRDRNHIVSHGQLQPWNRTDPGPNWPWSQYIDRVRALCGDGAGGTIIIDSNNVNNDLAVAKFELAGAWTTSSSSPGYYGDGFWAAQTEATSAPATFWFYLPTAQTRTIDAWWTSGGNRASAAPYIAFDATGTEIGRTTVDQRTNGSQWVTLGTWAFSAGWNKIVLSRWTTPGQLVIADAVRVR